METKLYSLSNIIREHLIGMLYDAEDHSERHIFVSKNHPNISIVHIYKDIASDMVDFIRATKSDAKQFESVIDVFLIVNTTESEDNTKTLTLMQLFEIMQTDIIFGQKMFDYELEEWEIKTY